MNIKNKTTLFFVLAIFAFAIIVGAYMLNNENTALSSNDKEQNITIVQASQAEDINSLDNLIKYSDNVIVGTVVGDENFSADTTKYTVTVDNNLKGTIETKDIDVYEYYDAMENDKQYILFLGYFDSPLYPRAVYTSIEKECIVEIDNEQLTGKKKFIEDNYTYKDIIKAIEKSPGKITKLKNEYDITPMFESAQDLNDSSDCIIQIKVRDAKEYNKYVSKVDAEIVKVFKGDIGEQKQFLLPSNVELGKEYIVFFKNEDGRLALSSREGSIISADNKEEWNKTIDLLTNTPNN